MSEPQPTHEHTQAELLGYLMEIHCLDRDQAERWLDKECPRWRERQPGDLEQLPS